MSLQTAFCNYLGSQSTITDLLTNNGASDIFWLKPPEGKALPVIVVQKISGQAEHVQGGATTLADARLQVKCMSDNPSEAAAIADAVRLRCDGLQGVSIGPVGGKVAIVRMKRENDGDGYDAPHDGSDDGTPDVTMEFHVWYRATVPTF